MPMLDGVAHRHHSQCRPWGMHTDFRAPCQVEVLTGDEPGPVAELEAGGVFGELALFNMRQRNVTIRAARRPPHIASSSHRGRGQRLGSQSQRVRVMGRCGVLGRSSRQVRSWFRFDARLCILGRSGGCVVPLDAYPAKGKTPTAHVRGAAVADASPALVRRLGGLAGVTRLRSAGFVTSEQCHRRMLLSAVAAAMLWRRWTANRSTHPRHWRLPLAMCRAIRGNGVRPCASHVPRHWRLPLAMCHSCARH